MGQIASHIYHTQCSLSKHKFKSTNYLLHKLNQPLLNQHPYFIFFSFLLFLFCHFINYILLYTMPFWIPLCPDIRELQTSRLRVHDAIPKLPISLSLLLEFEGLWCSIRWAPLHGLLSSHRTYHVLLLHLHLLWSINSRRMLCWYSAR